MIDMKIAIPTNNKKGLDYKVAEHFGRAKRFLIYDTEKRDFQTEENPEVLGLPELPPDFLHRQGANVIIVFSLGQRAYEKFKNYNIKIYKAIEGTIAENLQKIKNSKLKELTKEDIF